MTVSLPPALSTVIKTSHNLFDDLPQFTPFPLVHRIFHIIFLEVYHSNIFCLVKKIYLKGKNLDPKPKRRFIEYSYQVFIYFS